MFISVDIKTDVIDDELFIVFDPGSLKKSYKNQGEFERDIEIIIRSLFDIDQKRHNVDYLIKQLERHKIDGN